MFVEIVEYLVDGLLVAMLNILEFLCKESPTMLDDFSRLSMGIFSKV